jgi:two-component system, NtrC family, response regulator AtoC
VDDDESIRTSIADFLIRLGHKVYKCTDGRDALELLERSPVQLVLTDIQMPNIDGHELLRRLRESVEWSDIEVIMFTGHGDVKSAVEAMRNGAYDYLLKPINVRELAIMVERIGQFLTLKREHQRLAGDFDREVKRATRDMKKELAELRKAFAREVGAGDIGLYSETIRQVFRTARKLHRNRDIPVLIEGETGTGKEVLARYIHYGEGNVATPFIGVNCATIPQNLFESELFGYDAGAFTGGKAQGQKGKLELARGGTIFLDEITELHPEYQAKLLRVIQERKYYPVGGLREVITDVRVICATNRPIRRLVDDGDFREDLFYRLNTGHLRIPPLRERREEILPLARQFLLSMVGQKRSSISRITPEAGKLLEEYSWPGNIRQLRNAMERAALFSEGVLMQPGHLNFLFEEGIRERLEISPSQEVSSGIPGLNGEEFDLHGWTVEIVRKALEKHRWNRSRTAQYLKITRNELYTFLKYIEKSE